MIQLTKEQAIRFYENKFYEGMSHTDIFKFQLWQEKLCMPWGVFHEAAEKALNRPVFTHEFAYPDNLKKEFLGEKDAPTFDEIIELIPAEKRIILSVPQA